MFGTHVRMVAIVSTIVVSQQEYNELKEKTFQLPNGSASAGWCRGTLRIDSKLWKLPTRLLSPCTSARCRVCYQTYPDLGGWV